MHILTAAQIRAADAHTIANEPIASVDLMERAATACTNWITETMLPGFPAGAEIHLVCGMGNNGGDGLVIARQLALAGQAVAVSIARFAANGSPDFATNLERLQRTNVRIEWLTEDAPQPNLENAALVIDALFGTGLTRPISGWLAKLTKAINQRGLPVVAIDLPSGLFSESNANNTLETVVRATHTLTFEVPRLAFFYAENSAFCGHWHVLPIGLDQAFIASCDTDYHFSVEADVRPLVKSRPRFGHKGTFGHALLLVGARGTLGAGIMAARACLRAGAGLLTCCVPGHGLEVFQSTVPEAMALADEAADWLALVPKRLDKFTAIGMGPGIGTRKETGNALKLLIQSVRVPLVLDADALNLLAENKTWLSFLPPGTILTPHPGEFARLAGTTESGEASIVQLRAFCQRYNVYVVLKGAHTAVCSPTGKVQFNSTGNPGMATGGSGDVLTGILVGLLAQGYSAIEACKLGVYLHGLAGDLAAAELSMQGMIATDIIRYLPQACRQLQES